MTVEGIDHVNIRAPASDVRKLRDFYCDVVGLREGWRPEFTSRGHWLYAGDKPIVHLVEGDDVANSSAQAGVNHVAFRCANLGPYIERLTTRGINYQLSRVPNLGHEQLLFRDPLGIGVELSAGG